MKMFIGSVDEEQRARADALFVILSVAILLTGTFFVVGICCSEGYFLRAGIEEGETLRLVFRRVIFTLGSIGVLWICSCLPMRFYRRVAGFLFAAAVVLAGFASVFGIHNLSEGTVLSLGQISIRPVEFVFLALVLYYPSMLCRRADSMRSFRRGLLPFLPYTLGLTALLLLQREITAAVAFYLCSLAFITIGGGRHRWLVFGLITVVAVCFVAMWSSEYLRNEISVWQNPGADLSGRGAEILASVRAIANGSWFGCGIGGGTTLSDALLAERNDFMFSSVFEQTGYVGAMSLLLIFFLLVFRGFRLSVCAQDRYSALVGSGLSAWMAIKVFLAVSAAVNLLPVTGTTLPFFGAGGSDLLLSAAEMGIILSVSREVSLSAENLNTDTTETEVVS